MSTTLSTIVANVRDSSRRVVRQLGMLQRSYEDSGCTHSQCHALVEMEYRGQVTARDLSQSLLQDKSTISRALQPLIERGFVRSETDPLDQRNKPLSLTASGRRTLDRINRTANDRVLRALSQLSEAERETVVEGLALYARALERSRRMNGIEIGPIRKSDNAEMARIIRDVMTEFGAVGPGYSINDPEVDDMFGSYRDERSIFFVAQRNSRVIGGAGVGPLAGGDEWVCELRKMYVRPEGRGLGLGRKLLEICLDAARERGFRQCYLETLEHMTHARHLYRKFGFRALDGPMGTTGHCGCNSWSLLDL